MRGSPSLRNHVRSVMGRLRHLSTTLADLTTALKEEIDDFGAVTRNCGLALLPDEILASVFDLVVNTLHKDCSVGRKWKAARRLSHVDRQFRSVILACPRLWRNMNSSLQMVSACLPRTNGLPLSIDLTIDDNLRTHALAFPPVLTELLPVTKQWGRLRLTFFTLFTDKRQSDRDRRMFYTMHLVDAPLLEKLSIRYDDFLSDRSPHWNWSHWNTPNLRHVTAVSYFPFSLPGLSNVATLDLTVPIDNNQMSDMLKAISRMNNLRKFILHLLNEEDPGRFVLHERMEFPQIRHLILRTSLYFPIQVNSRALERSIFSSLFFPGLIQLDLRLLGNYLRDASGLPHTQEFHFNKGITRIFRHIDQFPRVESFHLDVLSSIDDHHDSDARSELCFPLNMLPSVKHFSLRSNTRFEIKESDDPDEILFEDERAVAPRVVGNAFPVLETVNLDLLDASVVARWLGEYLRNVQDRGKWDEFREFVIAEPDGTDDVGRRKVTYLGDKALAWCEDMMSRYADLFCAEISSQFSLLISLPKRTESRRRD